MRLLDLADIWEPFACQSSLPEFHPLENPCESVLLVDFVTWQTCGTLWTGGDELTVLLTGVAGFIGMHVADRLLAEGESVVGIDNLNSYYDPQLKLDRLVRLEDREGFTFLRCDIARYAEVEKLAEIDDLDRVVHLAAQAGVRYSLENPRSYVDSNLVGFANILELCRQRRVSHLVYASSSSVYGTGGKVPQSEDDNVDRPVSLYAATKKSNELMAHVYSHLFGIPTTGLRFFTVYGPWGRPDMAPSLFTKAILEGEPIEVFNEGHMRRDFTFIDDAVSAVVALIDLPPQPEGQIGLGEDQWSSDEAPIRLLNVGSNEPIELTTFIKTLEKVLGRTANKVMAPMQAGDVLETRADLTRIQEVITFRPRTELEDGLTKFVSWFRGYYNIE